MRCERTFGLCALEAADDAKAAAAWGGGGWREVAAAARRHGWAHLARVWGGGWSRGREQRRLGGGSGENSAADKRWEEATVWEVAVAATLGAVAAGDLAAAAEIVAVFPALRPLAATLGWDLLATTATATATVTTAIIPRDTSSSEEAAVERRNALHDSRERMMAALWSSRRGGGDWREKPPTRRRRLGFGSGSASGSGSDELEATEANDIVDGGDDADESDAATGDGSTVSADACTVERLCRRLQYRLEAAAEGAAATPNLGGLRGEILESLEKSSALAVVTELLSGVDPDTAARIVAADVAPGAAADEELLWRGSFTHLVVSFARLSTHFFFFSFLPHSLGLVYSLDVHLACFIRSTQGSAEVSYVLYTVRHW